MGESYTGGCACGAIRYAISGEPLVMSECQCRDCQRRSGTGHASYLTFSSRSAVKVTGEVKQWSLAADSGAMKSYAFCPTCGVPLYVTFPSAPEITAVHAASLDDPARYKPANVMYTVRGHAWDHLDPALKKFEKMPTSGA